MDLFGKETLLEYATSHADVSEQIKAWAAEIESAQWNNPHDLKARYPKASNLGKNMWVFDLKGNDYRLLAKVDFQNKIVLAKRIGTHAEYDRWEL